MGEGVGTSRVVRVGAGDIGTSVPGAAGEFVVNTGPGVCRSVVGVFVGEGVVTSSGLVGGRTKTTVGAGDSGGVSGERVESGA